MNLYELYEYFTVTNVIKKTTIWTLYNLAIYRLEWKIYPPRVCFSSLVVWWGLITYSSLNMQSGSSLIGVISYTALPQQVGTASDSTKYVFTSWHCLLCFFAVYNVLLYSCTLCPECTMILCKVFIKKHLTAKQQLPFPLRVIVVNIKHHQSKTLSIFKLTK